MKLSQLIAELHGCGPALDDEVSLIAMLEEGVAAVGAQVVEEARVRYTPHGLTVAVFLAESHALVSTWPEHRLALLDVLLCNDQMDPMVFCEKAESMLAPELGVHRQVVVRNIADSPLARSNGATD